LEKYINKNLKAISFNNYSAPENIQTATNTSFNNSGANTITPANTNEDISKYLYDNNLSTPVTILSKKDLVEENETLNYQYIKLSKINKSHVYNVSPYVFSNYKNHFVYNFNYFKDNQHTKMLTHYLKYTRNFRKLNIFLFHSWYNLYEKKNHKNGSYTGIGFTKNRLTFDIFKDKNEKNNIGWDLSYKFPYFVFNLNKYNLVYSRKTACSTNHTRLKAEITNYKYKNNKELWYSLAYEKIDDKNNVFTPQIDADLIYLKPINIYFAGWYQFSSKDSKCYYSPKKVDNNILGIKYNHNISKHLHLLTKAGIGYSFWDKIKLYEIGGWIDTINFDLFYSKFGCKYSNSSKNFSSKSYNYYECIFSVGKEW
jgi:hypothetical protein